jgi:hypothetical protein
VWERESSYVYACMWHYRIKRVCSYGTNTITISLTTSLQGSIGHIVGPYALWLPVVNWDQLDAVLYVKGYINHNPGGQQFPDDFWEELEVPYPYASSIEMRASNSLKNSGIDVDSPAVWGDAGGKGGCAVHVNTCAVDFVYAVYPFSDTHTLILSVSLDVSLSHSLSHAHTLSHTHTLSLTRTHSLSHAHTLSHTHTLSLTHRTRTYLFERQCRIPATSSE